MNTKKILFTGGGSSGHVTPNLALIEKGSSLGWDMYYIGSYTGIEKELISKKNIPYYAISTGKLRRYFSWKNFIDPFKIIGGCIQAFYRIHKIKPDVIFSKGGFVAFPVVFSGWLKSIPVIVHESDFNPGLANKLSFPFAKRICITFAETAKRIKYKDKITVTGTPIREFLFEGNTEKAKQLCDFSKDLKTLLVIGGGLGSKVINDTIEAALPELTQKFNVIHICGKGKVNKKYETAENYKQFEYVHEELADFMALADIVVSRAGANSLYELLVLKKPHILIPLSKKASRGDQIDNAKYFVEKGLSHLIEEEELSPKKLMETLKNMKASLIGNKNKLQELTCSNGTGNIIKIIISY